MPSRQTGQWLTTSAGTIGFTAAIVRWVVIK
jgi:hypothetical protein